MKKYFTHICFFVFLLINVSELFCQNLEKQISLDCKNIPLSELLTLIEKESGVHFSYSSQQIPVNKTVSIKARNASVINCLKQVADVCDFEIIVIEQTVVLKPSPQPTTVTQSNNQEQKITLSGTITDNKSGEFIIGALVWLEGTSYATTTNGYGFFSMNVPTGNYQIACSMLGYETTRDWVAVQNNYTWKKELISKPLEIISVVIHDSLSRKIRMDEQINISKINQSQLSVLPGIGGNTDFVKSLQSISGIKTYGDGSSLFYVRGGGSDQNLILIDEAPIYNPSHLFGFFSSISPDAINNVEIYKGGIPEKFGGRLSSVIDIKIKEGNRNHFSMNGNIGPYTSTLTLESPLKKEKASFIISGRKSTLEWVKNLAGYKNTLTLGFYDLNAKTNVTLNKNNRLFLSFFYGNDAFFSLKKISNNTNGIRWTNLLGSLRWNSIVSNTIFFNTTAYFSKYDYFLYFDKEKNSYWNSSVQDLSIKTDGTWFLDQKNTLRFGGEISYQYSVPGAVSNKLKQSSENFGINNSYRILDYTLYAGHEFSWWKKFKVHYGVRASLLQNIGPQQVYLFNPLYKVFDTLHIAGSKIFNNFLVVDPRFTCSYQYQSNGIIKIDYTRTSQFMHVITNSVSPFTTLEVWIPSGKNIKPQYVDQFDVGVFQQFYKNKLLISLEGFYKKFRNVIDYKDHADLLYNPLIEGELRFGKGESYGAEFQLKFQTQTFSASMNYVYARSFRTIEEINNGNRFAANFDSPHNIFINLAYFTGKHVIISANWMFLSGSPITTPTGFYYFQGISVPIYGAKNNDRLPDYHRLDVSVEIILNKPGNKFKHSLVLSANNVYAHKNPFALNNNKFDMNGNFVIPSDNSQGYTLVPTVMSVSGIFPSINYKFNF